MVKVPTCLNDLKTKADDLDVGKLKTVPIDLKKSSDVMDKQVFQKTAFNTLNIQVNNLEKNLLDASTLIETTQYNTDKQNLEKKVADVKNKIPNFSGLVTTNVLNAKINELKMGYLALVVL